MTEGDKFPFEWDDPTATSPDLSRSLLEETARRSVKQKNKQLRNHFYGSLTNPFDTRVRNEILTRIGEHPDSIMMNGREFERMYTAFAEAVTHVRGKQFDTDGYQWFVYPETFYLIRDLYGSPIRSRVSEPPIVNGDHEFHGIPFRSSGELPSGWVLLADTVETGRFDLQKPMVLIDEVDAGYREGIDIDVGGEIQVRVLNP